MNSYIHKRAIQLKFLTMVFFLGRRELPRKSLREHVLVADNFLVLENRVNLNNYFVSWKTLKLTKSHFNEIVKFIKANPDFTFIMFDNKTQDSWMREFCATQNPEIYKIYTGCLYPATKSDIFRLLLLNRYGGIYSGINRVSDKPLKKIFQKNNFICAFEKNKSELAYRSKYIPEQFREFNVVQHTIMGPSNHPIFSMAINKIINNSRTYNDKFFMDVPKTLWKFSAPGMLTEVLIDYLNKFGTQGIVFADFDYYNSYRLPAGHKFRYITSPSYLGARNKKILIIK